MELNAFWQEAVDQGLFWLLVPFALVVWWGFRPRRDRGKDDTD